MNVLELKNVVKQYQQHTAVNQVSFSVPVGDIFGLLGPNGAGKTSIIRIITAITKADQGEVYFNGEPLSAIHREQIGYMPEERGLYKKMKVGEQLIYLARLKGLSKREAKSRMDYWFHRFDIEDWYSKKIEELSKGMQQKIQFIATVIHQPKLLILDEPFSGLDPVNTNLIRNEIHQLHQSGVTILFSTHRMEQVEQICENIVLINNGQNVLEGNMMQIKQAYKDNLFRVTYQGSLPENLAQRTKILTQTDELLEVQLDEEEDSNEFLRYLLEQGTQIQSFQEILPSLNEIFIKVVKGQSDE